MPLDDQGCFDKIVSELRKAFSLDPLAAYAKFISRRKQETESIEAFLADLRKLAGLAWVGVRGDVDRMEPAIKTQFLLGLPPGNVRQHTLAAYGPDVALSVLVAKAKDLLRCEALDFSNADVLAAGVTTGGGRSGGDRGTGGGQSSSSNRGHNNSPRTCYTCKKEGHISRNCPLRKARAEKEEKKSQIAAGTPAVDEAGIAAGVVASPPMISVGLLGSNGVNVNVKALVDACCAITLVELSVVNWAGWKVGVIDDLPRLVTLAKQSLNLLGSVMLTVMGISVAVGVVDSLPGNISGVLGGDFIRKVGGVTVKYDEGQSEPRVSLAAGVFDRKVNRRTAVVEEPDGSVRLCMPDGDLRREVTAEGSYRWVASWK